MNPESPESGYLPTLPIPTQLEIEFTNRCNARCVACPRENMPGYGAITDQTLEDILSLYSGYTNPLTKSSVNLVIAGGGEPLLHNKIHGLLERCRASGLHVTLITNASRMHRVDLGHVLNQVDQLLISFWGIEPGEYEAAMKLDYANSLHNVEMAIEMAAVHSVPLAVQWLRSAAIRSDDMAIREFWQRRGVTDLRGGDLMWNRAGTLKDIDLSLKASESLPPDFSKRIWCSDLYFSDCFSWNGELTLCCCDFFNGARTTLGHISSLSLDQIAAIKNKMLRLCPPKQCVNCRLPRRQRPFQLANGLLGALCEEEIRMLCYQ